MNSIKYHKENLLKIKGILKAKIISKKEITDSLNVGFENISNISKDQLILLKDYFQDKLSPIYGDQGESFKKLDNKDRVTKIMIVNGEIGGILSFKSTPQFEYESNLGIRKYLEIKSLSNY